MTILQRVKTVSWQDAGINPAEMIRLVELADWAAHVPPDEVVILIEDPSDYTWDETIFPPGKLDEASAKFEKGVRLAFHVPVSVSAKSGEPKKSYFEVFLERDDKLSKAQDRYIRNGITIPDIPGIYGKPVRGLLVVKDGPLSTFLGDAENPSHTTWEDRSSKIKKDYDQGVSRLRFVKNGLKSLVALLTKTSEGLDKDLLKDVFYVELPELPGVESGEKPKDKAGRNSTLPKIPKLSGSHPLQLTYVKGGFQISKKMGVTGIPKKVRVTVAYDARRGNPFGKYDKRDFQLDRAPIKVDARDVDIHEKKENSLEFSAVSDNFSITVKGFDKKRDLKVRIS